MNIALWVAYIIPDISSTDYIRLVGDCIYDFPGDKLEPVLRDSVHNSDNMRTDLSGVFVLLSNEY